MPAKKLLLHVGSGRTGTTSLQNCLRRNAELLKQRGIFYPAPRQLAVIGARLAHTGNGAALMRYLQPDLRETYFDEAHFIRKLTELLESTSNSMLISNEMLEYANEDRLTAFVEHCRRHNTTVRAIYVGRDWLDHAYSVWRFLVAQQGLCSPWETFLTEQYPKWVEAMCDTLQKLKRVLDRDLVTLRYSPNIIHDFFDTIGVDYNELQPAAIENSSLPLSELPQIATHASDAMALSWPIKDQGPIVSLETLLLFLDRAHVPMATVNTEFFHANRLKFATSEQIAL